MGAKEFGWGVFSGAAIGVTLAILFAPQSGEETRKQIATAAGDLKDSATNILEQAKDSLGDAATKIEGALGLQERRVRQKMDELKEELAKYSAEAEAS
ncbi:MAG: YtxH domain-containing protein [Actinomycetota bacterium]